MASSSSPSKALISYTPPLVVSAMLDPSSQLDSEEPSLLLVLFERSLRQNEDQNPKTMNCRDLCTHEAHPKPFDPKKALELQHFIDANPALQSELKSRSLELMDQVRANAASMGIPAETIESLDFCWDIDSLGLPYVLYPKSSSDNFQLHIPLLFLVNLTDLQTQNEIYALVEKVYQLNPNTKQMMAFYEFLSQEDSGINIKSFMLFHELAHIANGDHETTTKHYANGGDRSYESVGILSRKFEKRADITAAYFLGRTEAGISCMHTMQKYSTSEYYFHPTDIKRATYLEKYGQEGDQYLWKQIEKMHFHLGHPDLITNSPFSTSPSRAISPVLPAHISCLAPMEDCEEIIVTSFTQVEEIDIYTDGAEGWHLD
jgi:hypothetical protein